jgi:hydrogenase expression/formation protein HypE
MKIELSHGNGGHETGKLITEHFMPFIGNPQLKMAEDAAIIDSPGKLAYTTDSFVVKPLFFPGGDIGRLAVCGSANDLLSMGAVPSRITLGFILETGLDTGDLKKILSSVKDACEESGFIVAAADTKVVEGNGSMMIGASAIGFMDKHEWRPENVALGDSIIVTGHMGEHHACILSQRLGIENGIQSDAAPMVDLCKKLKEASVKVHAMRDITRGGLATTLFEISSSCGLKMAIEESLVPVSHKTMGLCMILGLDPLTMGNEGKMLIFVSKADSSKAIDAIGKSRYCEHAMIIGETMELDSSNARVAVKTSLGAWRIAGPLRGEGLPRIC